jgi:gliding motility-associated-like protein
MVYGGAATPLRFFWSIFVIHQKSMRIICLLFLYCLTPLVTTAQKAICDSDGPSKYVQYQLKESGFQNLEVNGIRHSDQGYWVSGFIDKTTSVNKDFIVSKLNDTGGVIFTKVIGNTAQEGGYCSALPIKDGCLISGRSKGLKDVALIAKISNTGVIEWSKTTESQTGNYDAIRGVHMDESKGQIVAVGTGMQKTGQANVMILSLDKDGNTLWTRNIDLGGAQHHLNAIRKVDSIYQIAGWAMFSGIWRPTLIKVSETGRFVNGQYANVSENAIYVDMEVSPSGKTYLLGFAIVSGSQYAFLTCLSKTGSVLWRKNLGFGNSDFGDNLFFEDGSLWVFGQTVVPAVGKREFFVQYDTSGSVLKKGGLYESPFAFSAKINGWPVGRSHSGGIAVVGVDNRGGSNVHFEIMFTKPCDTRACSVNPLSGFNSLNYSVSDVNINTTKAWSTNGNLVDVALSAVDVNLIESESCYKNCAFTATKRLPTTFVLCNGGTDVFTAIVRNGNCKYLWNDGDTASKKEILSPGMYWVKTYNECGFRIDTVVVEGVEAPIFSRLSDTMFCEKQWLRTINLKAMPQTSIMWENGDLQWSRSFTVPGKYWYEVKNRCGVWRDTFVITEDSAPKSVLPKQMTLCNGSNAFLDGNQLGKGKYQYRWEDGSTVPTSWVYGSAIKILKTSNLCGSINDTVNVVFGECDCQFWIPNAFTPRASTGKNDGWKPEFNCAADAKFSIYSRWGECLVRDQSINVPWDGFYMGDLVPDGVYVYIIYGYYTSSTKGWQRLDKSGTLLVLDGGK